MSEIFQSPRGIFIGALFIILVCTLIWAIWYGRRLARTEVTDLVFGNPLKAMGGYHWVISGVSTVLLLWLYFSWDAARAFFPMRLMSFARWQKLKARLYPCDRRFHLKSDCYVALAC